MHVSPALHIYLRNARHYILISYYFPQKFQPYYNYNVPSGTYHSIEDCKLILASLILVCLRMLTYRFLNYGF